MALSDPIADFLTRVRNGSTAERRYVDVSWSKMNENLCEIFKAQGFIDNFIVRKESETRGTIRVFLKYSEQRKPVIKGLERISKPGLRKYVKSDEIPNFYGGYGLAIVSTSQGVMPGLEAKQRRIGGELLCKIW
ncbi:30S ribosomal protein S8 [Estrella lausannensis]|uniref:Small ribosomal subunit protein uS8 n=1 Tax=Estrella lausannensis TaxID=483423 RepID=A0A0H5E3R7_9BACT|nr:30S ribosomal protein S8 [Estrella lausannensis]CRX37860.1 30S ribosomal protein S8 [Estrella lausannensis]